MPAVSGAQHGFMGLVLSVKQGKRKLADVQPGMREKVKRAASEMTEQQVKDYTATPASNLPRRQRGPQPHVRARAT